MRFPILLAVLALLDGPVIAQPADGEPYRVFFDWSKPDLTRDAQTILNDVAAAYQARRPQLIGVAGYTDRSGPAAVNLAASRRRAEAVKAYLVEHGVPVRVISVSGYGESRPIVPTEDGVREVQNRRVEIRFEGGAAGSVDVAMVRGDGTRAGTASLSGNQLTIDANGLTPGVHGMHLHAVGRCDGPDFASAGPHWNPASRKHGMENPEGPHQGDLPNLTTGADGHAVVTIEVPAGMMDADGTALVIHAAADDNRTDPSGNSGARIACAAFTR
jgi:Cu-Zn family superoxide dismutase